MKKEELLNCLNGYEKLLSDKKLKLEEYDAQIQKSKEAKAKVLERINGFYNSDSAEVPHDAMEEKRTLDDIIELYQKKYEALNASVLIPDKAEYTRQRDAILEALEADKQDAVEEIAKLLNKIINISNEFIEKAKIGNKALYVLQKDLYCDKSLTVKGNSGAEIELSSARTEFKHEFNAINQRMNSTKELLKIK